MFKNINSLLVNNTLKILSSLLTLFIIILFIQKPTLLSITLNILTSTLTYFLNNLFFKTQQLLIPNSLTTFIAVSSLVYTVLTFLIKSNLSMLHLITSSINIRYNITNILKKKQLDTLSVLLPTLLTFQYKQVN